MTRPRVPNPRVCILGITVKLKQPGFRPMVSRREQCPLAAKSHRTPALSLALMLSEANDARLPVHTKAQRGLFCKPTQSRASGVSVRKDHPRPGHSSNTLVHFVRYPSAAQSSNQSRPIRSASSGELDESSKTLRRKRNTIRFGLLVFFEDFR